MNSDKVEVWLEGSPPLGQLDVSPQPGEDDDPRFEHGAGRFGDV